MILTLLKLLIIVIQGKINNYFTMLISCKTKGNELIKSINNHSSIFKLAVWKIRFNEGILITSICNMNPSKNAINNITFFFS